MNAMSPETPDEFLNSFMSHSSMGSVCPKGIWNGHYLSDKEIQLLRKSMKSIRNRVDVEEDVSVLESLRKYGEAINLWPEKQLPDPGYTKGYFETHSQYQPPVQEERAVPSGIKSEDIARVLSMWLSEDKEPR